MTRRLRGIDKRSRAKRATMPDLLDRVDYSHLIVSGHAADQVCARGMHVRAPLDPACRSGRQAVGGEQRPRAPHGRLSVKDRPVLDRCGDHPQWQPD